MTYMLRVADKPLWKAFKARALKDGHSIRWILETLIRRYVDRGMES